MFIMYITENMANMYRKGKGRKRNYAKVSTRSSKAKVSKPLRKAIKQVMKTEVETKSINVPQNAGTTNTIGLIYPSGSGLQYLVQDVFKMPQGVQDSTVLNAPNRVGDKIRGVGFLMDYYIHGYGYYTLGAASFQVPYIKVRVTVWKQAFGSPLLTSPLLYDTNFLAASTSTLQPVNWNEGFVKDVLMDKVYIIKSNYAPNVATGAFSAYPISNVFHFKKYFKYDHLIKFCDNNSTSPNSTTMPIYITLSAEVDDANTFVPSGARLLNTTGYTRAWFKDA